MLGLIFAGGMALSTDAKAASGSASSGFCAFCGDVEECSQETAEAACRNREGCSTGMAECGAFGNCSTLIVCNV